MATKSTKRMRKQLIKFMDENEENFYKVYTYLNGNLCQCWTYQAEFIISEEEELSNESVIELHKYIFGE